MVRTKQIRKHKNKPSTNGARKSLPAGDKAIKAPAQPAELSEKDRQQLKNWLDGKDKPFGIQIAPSSQSLKRKRDDDWQLQTDLFEDRLSLRYQVRPKDKWECLRRYKKFTGESRRSLGDQCDATRY